MWYIITLREPVLGTTARFVGNDRVIIIDGEAIPKRILKFVDEWTIENEPLGNITKSEARAISKMID